MSQLDRRDMLPDLLQRCTLLPHIVHMLLAQARVGMSPYHMLSSLMIRCWVDIVQLGIGSMRLSLTQQQQSQLYKLYMMIAQVGLVLSQLDMADMLT
jgi:hypothetical protein